MLMAAKGECCSKRCYNRWYKDAHRIPSKCQQCGSDIFETDWRTTKLCQRCLGIRMQSGRDQNGTRNPHWLGGHRTWLSGRYGKDKNGLSWKKQRLLCMARDDGQCQDPTCTSVGLRICVHHNSPYRISYSHALENLSCLCDPCHGKADAEFNRNNLLGIITVMNSVVTRNYVGAEPTLAAMKQ